MENTAGIEAGEVAGPPWQPLSHQITTTGQLLCGGHTLFGAPSKSATESNHSSQHTPVTTGALIFGGDKKWLHNLKKRSHQLATDTKDGLKPNEFEFNFLVESKLNRWLTKLTKSNNQEENGGMNDEGEDVEGSGRKLDKIDEQEENEGITNRDQNAELLPRAEQNVISEVHLINTTPGNHIPSKDCCGLLLNPDLSSGVGGEGTILERKPAGLHLDDNNWNRSVMKSMCERERALRKTRFCHFCSVSDSDDTIVDDDNHGNECAGAVGCPLQAVESLNSGTTDDWSRAPNVQKKNKKILYKQLTCKSQNTIDRIIQKQKGFAYPPLTNLLHAPKHLQTTATLQRATATLQRKTKKNVDEKTIIIGDGEIGKSACLRQNGHQTFDSESNLSFGASLYLNSKRDGSSGDTREHSDSSSLQMMKLESMRRKQSTPSSLPHSWSGQNKMDANDWSPWRANDSEADLLYTKHSFDRCSGDHEGLIDQAAAVLSRGLMDQVVALNQDFDGNRTADMIQTYHHTATCSSLSVGFSCSKGCYRRKEFWKQEYDGNCCSEASKADDRCMCSMSDEDAAAAILENGYPRNTGDSGDPQRPSKELQHYGGERRKDEHHLMDFEKKKRNGLPRRRKKKFGFGVQFSYYVPNRFCAGKTDAQRAVADEEGEYCKCALKKQERKKPSMDEDGIPIRKSVVIIPDEPEQLDPDNDAYLNIVDPHQKVSDWLEPPSTPVTNDEGTDISSEVTVRPETPPKAEEEEKEEEIIPKKPKYILTRSTSDADILYIRKTTCDDEVCKIKCQEMSKEECVKIYTKLDAFEVHGNYMKISACEPVGRDVFEIIQEWMSPCRYFN